MRCDVYVFPSRHEGFAVAPLEAMACGLRVVAASASGISDVFCDGQEYGGIVVPINDAESLAKSLGCLLDDDEAALTLGERARGRAEKAFSVKYVGAHSLHSSSLTWLAERKPKGNFGILAELE